MALGDATKAQAAADLVGRVVSAAMDYHGKTGGDSRWKNVCPAQDAKTAGNPPAFKGWKEFIAADVDAANWTFVRDAQVVVILKNNTDGMWYVVMKDPAGSWYATSKATFTTLTGEGRIWVPEYTLYDTPKVYVIRPHYLLGPDERYTSDTSMVTFKTLTSNVAKLELQGTLTVASAAVGQHIRVIGIGAPFDTPDAVITDSTFTSVSYTAVGANVPRTATTGSISSLRPDAAASAEAKEMGGRVRNLVPALDLERSVCRCIVPAFGLTGSSVPNSFPWEDAKFPSGSWTPSP